MKNIKSLIKGECSNFDYENNLCLPKDQLCCFFVGDEGNPRCKYFEEGVLPLEPTLENQYRFERDMGFNTDMKKCEKCGNYIAVNSNNQKYCDNCKIDIRKKKNRERVQKQRCL
jgi:hypothetical protein